MLKLFIDEARNMDSSLRDKDHREWPFDFQLQREAWLKTLSLHDPERDTERDLRLPWNGTNGPVE